MEDIKEKIRKLLSLKNSPNRHEAALAAAKAQELMDKYSIETFELHKEDCKVEDKSFLKGKRLFKHHVHFAASLAGALDCVAYSSRYNGETELSLIGFKQDVELFHFFYEYLKEVVEAEYKKALSKWKKEISVRANLKYSMKIKIPKNEVHFFKKGFWLGAAEEISKRIKNERKEVHLSDGRDLVLVKKDEIEKAVKQKGLRYKKSNMGSASADGFQRGQEAAQGIQLKKAVNEK